MCRQCAGRGQGALPARHAESRAVAALDGATRSMGGGFGGPQKPRSRGEGPLAPPGAVSQEISDPGHHLDPGTLLID